MRSMRTEELAGTVAELGCDEVEATGNAVAVQQMPEAERKAPGHGSQTQRHRCDGRESLAQPLELQHAEHHRWQERMRLHPW